jgi:hypothetical protein
LIEKLMWISSQRIFPVPAPLLGEGEGGPTIGMGRMNDANAMSSPIPTAVAVAAAIGPSNPALLNPAIIEGMAEGPGKVAVAAPTPTVGCTVVTSPSGNAAESPIATAVAKGNAIIPWWAIGKLAIIPATRSGGGIAQGSTPVPAPAVPTSTVTTVSVPTQIMTPAAIPPAS